MKERPILFSAPMVRALLDGSKTQTRRVVKPQPKMYEPGQCVGVSDMINDALVCPYGQPGDRLWVRETWGVVSNDWDEDSNLIDWVPDRPATAISEMPFGKGYYSGHAIYAADGSHEWAGDDDGGGEPRSAWHPSIHMPRIASRILLEIVSVRVERLNNITLGDICKEGMARSVYDFLPATDGFRVWKELWESINGSGSYDANPWVWVVEFKRVAP